MTVPIANERDAAPPARPVIGIVGIRQGKAFGDPNLGLDQVQPVEAVQQSEESRVIMDVREVVEEDIHPRWG